MKTLSVVAMLFLAMTFMCYAKAHQKTVTAIPAPVRRDLGTRYSHWQMSHTNEQLESFLKDDHSVQDTNILKGDFNGDGQEDVAVLITFINKHLSKVALVCYLKKGNKYDHHLLKEDRNSFKGLYFILILKNGTRGDECCNDGWLIYKHDSIFFGTKDHRGECFIYDDGVFKRKVKYP